ncbi:MAG: heparinase II/III family protein [Flavobacteriales bacterium]
MTRRFDGSSVELFQKNSEEKAAFLLDAFLAHRFDVLGSGWVEWSYESPATGIEGMVHSRTGPGMGRPSFENALFKRDYEPIAWHRDLKSGFVWPSDTCVKDALKAHKGVKGADPKVPIELGRLHHLPRIPFLIKSLGRDPIPYIQEFHDQVLDFWACNPPGIGLNWTYSMDVGIRVMNLLLAWDLFKAIDEKGILDGDFDRSFHSSVIEHARYIMDHLEFQDGLTGNHYIFNLTGLLFAGAYIEGDSEADKWLGFGIEGLIRELFKQFRDDGGVFEGSTAYHRLSVEGILWGCALISGERERLVGMGWDEEIRLSKWSLDPPEDRTLKSTAEEPLPHAFRERLVRSVEWMKELRKPDGRMPQIGDNDSGRAVKLTPIGDMLGPKELSDRYERRGEGEELPGHEKLWDEDPLELYSFHALAEALFDEEASEKGGMAAPLDFGTIRSLKRGRGWGHSPMSEREEPVIAPSKKFDHAYEKLTEIPLERNVELKEGGWCVRPLSGVHVYRAPGLHLTISAWSGNGLRHTLGHAHCDRLSFELNLDGEDKVVDPGSYIYGALREERDRFRSGAVHNIPLVKGKEQLWWTDGPMGLFFARSNALCSVIEAEDRALTLLLEYEGVRHERTFRIEADRLLLLDRSDHPFRVHLNYGDPHSWGYGKKLKKKG